MLYDLFFQLESKDWFIILAGFLLTAIWTVLWAIILYKLKPNLEIESVVISDKTYKIKVKNKGCFNAVNLRIEACLFRIENEIETYHLKLNMDDFIIIPRKKLNQENYRIFTIRELSFNKAQDKLKNEEYKHLRVRVHAYHEYSGFGKVFEQKFEWDKNNMKFINI